MSDERRQHGWPFWCRVILITGPVLYVGSFGPACWLKAQPILPGGTVPVATHVSPVYWPLGMLARNDESRAGQWLQWWITVGTSDGQTVMVPISSDGGMFAPIRR